MATVMYTLCPKCGNFYIARSAECGYCKYIGTIPLLEEEGQRYLQILKSDEVRCFSDAIRNSQAYLNELREKYQLKQSPVYDEILWNNRTRKDEIQTQKGIKESDESDERMRQYREEEKNQKLSWRDRNRAFGVTCPTCGSSDHVYRISAAKKGFLAGLMGAASAGLQAKTFQCKNCGYKW